MAGLKTTDCSPAADALLLAALFLPLAPAVTTFELFAAGAALGCPAGTASACAVGGLDLNRLYAGSAAALQWTARAGAGAPLLLYIALLAGLAQFTTHGLRGRMVRTTAVIMWAGVLPLVVALAAAVERGAAPGGGPIAGFAFYGNMLFDWMANIAVPLAVLVTALVALTMGYRMLVARLVRLVLPRERG